MDMPTRLIFGTLLIALTIPTADLARADGPAPEAEFASGHISVFSSAGHPKAKGLVLRIEYPASWGTMESRHPNAVQNLFSEKGRGLQGCVITIKEIPPGEPITALEIDELLSDAGLRATVPPDALFRSGKRTKINALPASFVRWARSFENAGVAGRQETLQVTAISPHHVIGLTFSVGRTGEGHEDAVLADFARFEKLFQLMANSVVVENQWH